ncbi:cytochrome-c peroxidase [Sphingopyxis indica]|uniref:cytochrome-c peroxidase n=1 Tax=Sphingopyxis indica TaxID=436663 RepID=UPI0029391BA8|nr:cytochrome-c peroxidase [Sphingopyxis indica]WOF44985.1 cytochrome-c peroxidase [Sphingopyxis indica]
MRLLSLFAASGALVLAACSGETPKNDASGTEAAMVPASEELMGSARQVFKPLPSNQSLPQGDVATPEKIALGAMLYFDPRLSASHAISCASCHSMGLGGADAQPTSIGHHWQHGGRNAPTVFNAAFNMAQFWDGRARDLTDQAGGPMVNPVEMASAAPHVIEQLKGIPGYRDAFGSAFPGDVDPISLPHAQAAIAAFELTLVTPNAPFDRYLRGDAAALSVTQKAGLKLFMDKGCTTCHNGMNIGGNMYAKFGVAQAPGPDLLPRGDLGRFTITKQESDRYAFKVPTLRNIALTAPYFHTGKVWDLREAIAVMARSQLGTTLSQDEVTKIEAFLQSLTGDQPKIVLPALPPSVGTTPRPEN